MKVIFDNNNITNIFQLVVKDGEWEYISVKIWKYAHKYIVADTAILSQLNLIKPLEGLLGWIKFGKLNLDAKDLYNGEILFVFLMWYQRLNSYGCWIQTGSNSKFINNLYGEIFIKIIISNTLWVII